MALQPFQYDNNIQVLDGLITGETDFVLTPANLSVISFPQTIFGCKFRFSDGDGNPLGTGTGYFIPEGFKGTNSIVLSENIVYILIVGPIQYYFTNITKNSATIHWNYADFSDPLDLELANGAITIHLPLQTSGSYQITGLNPDSTYNISFQTQWIVSDSQEGLGTLTTLPNISFGLTWLFSPL